MAFYNKQLNNQKMQTLAQALAGSKRDNTQVTPYQPIRIETPKNNGLDFSGLMSGVDSLVNSLGGNKGFNFGEKINQWGNGDKHYTLDDLSKNTFEGVGNLGYGLPTQNVMGNSITPLQNGLSYGLETKNYNIPSGLGFLK